MLVGGHTDDRVGVAAPKGSGFPLEYGVFFVAAVLCANPVFFGDELPHECELLIVHVLLN